VQFPSYVIGLGMSDKDKRGKEEANWQSAEFPKNRR
jgi:hypothetical protein